MDTDNTSSYHDLNELPNLPWASHMVRPQAPDVPQQSPSGLAFSPVDEEFYDYDNDIPEDEEDLEEDFGEDVYEVYDEPYDTPTAGVLQHTRHPTEAVDSIFDPKDEQVQSIAKPSASQNHGHDENDMIDDNAENVGAGIRGRPRGRPRGSRARGRGGGYKRQLEEIDDRLGLLAKPGHRGRGRGRGRSRKGYGGAQPSRRTRARNQRKKESTATAEFTYLHEEASRAYIEGDYDYAEECISQAIEKNPEISTVHALLAEILEAKGEKIRAPWVLFAGAHVRFRDPQAWIEAADGIQSFMGRQSVEDLGQLVQVDENTSISLYTQCSNYVLHCYSQAIALDRNSHEAHQKRAVLLQELGSPKRALRDFQWLVEHGDIEILRNSEFLHYVASMSLEVLAPARALPMFEKILEIYPEDNSIVESIDWDHVNLLAELYLRASNSSKGLKSVKKLARILLGRGEEDYWDSHQGDDREYDLNDHPRRLEIPEFTPRESDAFGAGIPIDLRVKLGRLRLSQDDVAEAMRHFEWIKYDEDDSTIEEFTDFYLEAARSLYENALFENAITFLEPLSRIAFRLVNEDSDMLADCYEQIGRYDEAEELYLALSETGEDSLMAIEKLAKMFSRADMADRAEPYLQRLTEERRKRLRYMEFPFDQMPSRRREREFEMSESDEEIDDIELPSPDPSNYKNLLLDPRRIGSLGPHSSTNARRVRLPKAKGLNNTGREQLRTLDENEARQCFKQIDQIEELSPFPMHEWVPVARKLLNIFRSQKVFYPYDKHQRFWGYTAQARAFALKAKAEQELWEKELRQGRLDKSTSILDTKLGPIPTEFSSASFSRWLDTFLRYAICKAMEGKAKEAFDACQGALDANVFYHSREATRKIYNVWAACAAMVNDEENISLVSRYFMKDEQFVGDAYRLYSALNLAKGQPNTLFNASHNLKFVLRHIKAMDWALLSEEGRLKHESELTSRAVITRLDPDTTKPMPPTEASAELLMMYALMLYVGQSHYEALAYMLRVYAIRPNDLLLNLLMGLCYLGCSFKRLSTNRQYQIMQGLSLVTRYYDLRRQSTNPLHKQEAEFNMGRTYQLLGLNHLSIPFYERCLQMSNAVDHNGESENFAIEAAFALQNIWAMNGQAAKAEKIIEEWLVL